MNKQITVFSGICVKDNKVLMVLRDEEENPAANSKWEFPGGKCDFDETPQQSLVREFKEEAGLIVKVKELLPFVQTAYWDYEWGRQQTLCFLFLCEYLDDYPLEKRDHHVKEIRWFSFNEIKKLDSLPGTNEVISLVRKLFG